MTRRNFAVAVGAAVSGMVAATSTALGQGKKDSTAEKHVCKGANACKGQGGCKTGDKGCAGKNSCKGKGGCATAEKHSCHGANACKGQGGCKTGDKGCAGKNSCKGKGGCAVPLTSKKSALRLRDNNA